MSPDDAVAIRAEFGVRHVGVVDNGVDTGYFRPGAADERVPGRILFLGSLDWRPNLDAVDQLLERHLPRGAGRGSLGSALPGRAAIRPSPCGGGRPRTPGVELHADVPDVRPLLAQAAVMVVPLRIGGGSRLKILEALAAGTPVISTRVGAEGLDVRDGEHLVVVEDCREMARAILDHGRAEATVARMVRAGRRLVEDRYDWDILANALDAIWREAAPGGLPSCSALSNLAGK